MSDGSVAERLPRTLFLFFFLSGAASLLYQVVWLRLAFAAFGVVTPVLSVVVSVFMAGLFLGSWWGGRWISRLSSGSARSAIWSYAAAELVVGAGALAVPAVFDLGSAWLRSSGASDSARYLLGSALAITAAMVLPCVAMGTTFPFAMAYVRARTRSEPSSFSFLYLSNVLGAMSGTLVSALVLIESFGFRGTLRLGALANLAIGLGAVALGWRAPSRSAGTDPEPAGRGAAAAAGARPAAGDGGRAVLFCTGLCAMGSEVVWVRAFTPVLGTQVYSFALLLFVYLLATWVGSTLYRRRLRSGPTLSARILLQLSAAAALLPVLATDPRLDLRAAGALLGVAPFCALLGYLTPKLIDELAAGDPDRAGRAYAINVLGCILGPLLASYVLLPAVGTKVALGLFAAPLFLLPLRRLGTESGRSGWPSFVVSAAGAVALLAVARSYEEAPPGARPPVELRRDSTATVISHGEGLAKHLLVNGIGMTELTTTTKVMAHLPLALLERAPSRGLVVCLGMGTSWRSLLSWGIDATAVELIPSVREALPFYHADARSLLAQPNARIAVDDGRRFLERTEERYDVIVIDPPPPITAAGSSLLYSEQFYALAREHLSADGVLQQWFPATRGATLRAVALTVERSFPHVAFYRSPAGDGFHLLASEAPIAARGADELLARMPARAAADLGEWLEGRTARGLLEALVAGRVEPRSLTGGFSTTITDDRPFNEYFLLRFLRSRSRASS